MTKTTDVDLCVIGGGSGGVRAARIAATHGARVALAEEYRMGGTCVIRGCVPKKLFVYAARVKDDIQTAKAFGWNNLSEAAFDWQRFKNARDAEINRLEGLYTQNLERHGVTIYPERALIRDPHTIELSSGKTITAKTILIATGGTPFTPQISGHEHMMTSNEIFELTEQPKSALIHGAGYIALEFASILNKLGTDVTVIYRRDKVLRGFDEDLRDRLQTSLEIDGIKLELNTNLTAISKTGKTLSATLENTKNKTKKLDADIIMSATGRKPNIVGLGLENVGIHTTPSGAIITNGHAQTNIPNIYAVGDVTDTVALTPIAIREGHAFADTVFGNTPRTMHYANIPTAVFTTPEIGTVGLTESEARDTLDDVKVYTSEFRAMQTVLKGGNEKVYLKMIVAGDNERIVGCSMFGGDAGEIMQMIAVALNMGATKQDFDNTIALHPSLAEEWVTL